MFQDSLLVLICVCFDLFSLFCLLTLNFFIPVLFEKFIVHTTSLSRYSKNFLCHIDYFTEQLFKLFFFFISNRICYQQNSTFCTQQTYAMNLHFSTGDFLLLITLSSFLRPLAKASAQNLGLPSMPYDMIHLNHEGLIHFHKTFIFN